MNKLCKFICATIILILISGQLYALSSSKKKSAQGSVILSTYLTEKQFGKVVKNSSSLVKRSNAKAKKNPKLKNSMLKWNKHYLILSDSNKCRNAKALYELFVFFPDKVIKKKLITPPVLLVCAKSKAAAVKFTKNIQNNSENKISLQGSFTSLSRKQAKALVKLFN